MKKQGQTPIIFGLTASKALAGRICAALKVEPAPVRIDHFSDGEIKVVSEVSVRNRDVFVVQSTCPPVSDNVIELLIAIDMLKRASANSITVVIPYFGYARQDRKAKGREPITAKLMARMIESAGATKVVLMDVHSDQLQGFFEVPVDSLRATWILWKALDERSKGNAVVVAPDYGAIKRVRRIAESLDLDIAAVDKRRTKKNEAEAMSLLGEVAGLDCVILDDMIDTGGTVVAAAKLLHEKGAKSVRLAATHGVFSGPAAQRLTDAVNQGFIDEIFITDSIPVRQDVKIPRLNVVSLAPFFADVIKAILTAKPISDVYSKYARKQISR